MTWSVVLVVHLLAGAVWVGGFVAVGVIALVATVLTGIALLTQRGWDRGAGRPADIGAGSNRSGQAAARHPRDGVS